MNKPSYPGGRKPILCNRFLIHWSIWSFAFARGSTQNVRTTPSDNASIVHCENYRWIERLIGKVNDSNQISQTESDNRRRFPSIIRDYAKIFMHEGHDKLKPWHFHSSLHHQVQRKVAKVIPQEFFSWFPDEFQTTWPFHYIQRRNSAESI